VSADQPPARLRVEIAPRTILLILLVIAGVWLASQLGTVLIVVTIAGVAAIVRGVI